MNFIHGIISFLIISFSKVSALDTCYFNNNYEFFDELFEFNDWRLSHNVDFSSPEEIIWRHSIWQKNKQFVDSHNAEERGFEVSLNHLAHEEWPLNCNLMSNDVLQETYFEDPHDKLYSSNIAELKVVENFQVQANEDFEAFESEDTLSILNRYIEEAEIFPCRCHPLWCF